MSEENKDLIQVEQKQEIIQPSIEYITSKVVPNGHPQYLLHLIIRKEHFNNISNRGDIISQNELIQIAMLNLVENQTFKPHRHIFKTFHTESFIASEIWIVIEGSIESTYYDLDGKEIIDRKILNAGDLTCTLRGGHNYCCLSEKSKVYEIKQGPYQGVSWDKTFI